MLAVQNDLSERQLLLPQAHKKIVHRGRKGKNDRNPSVISPELQREAEEGVKALRLEGTGLTPIDSLAVKQFLFLHDLDQTPSPAPNAHKRHQHTLSIESLSGDGPGKK